MVNETATLYAEDKETYGPLIEMLPNIMRSKMGLLRPRLLKTREPSSPAIAEAGVEICDEFVLLDMTKRISSAIASTPKPPPCDVDLVCHYRTTCNLKSR